MSCGDTPHNGHSSVGYVLESILLRYCRSKGDLLVLSCASLRLVCLGSVSSSLSMSGACLLSILFTGLSRRWSLTIVVWIVFRFVLMSSWSTVLGSVSIRIE